MSLPSPTLSVPSLTDYQIYYQGITFGAGTSFNIKGSAKGIDGAAKAPVRSGDTPRPRTRGSYVGLNLLDERAMTVTLDIGPFRSGSSYANLQAALGALRTAVNTEGTTEYPLWLQLPNSPLLCMMCRVDKEDIPVDIVYDLGGVAQNVSLGFKAADPYWYAAPTLDPVAGLPTPGTGFVFPFSFNLSFGGGTAGNVITAMNYGDVSCAPTIVVTGPCLNPIIANESVAGVPTLTFDISLNTNDQLIIDCDMGSVVYYPAGSSSGSVQISSMQPGSTFLSLVPGENQISFNSQDLATVPGTMNLWYTSTYSSAV